MSTAEEINSAKKIRYFVPTFSAVGLVGDDMLENLLTYVGAPDDCRVQRNAARLVMTQPEPPEAVTYQMEEYSAPQTGRDAVDLGDGLTGKLVGSSGSAAHKRAKKAAEEKAAAAAVLDATEEMGENALF